VPTHRKRVGRLRLLVSALVVTTISVVGAVGTASAAPDPTGTLEICKVASGQGVTGTFGFRVAGRDGTIEVPVGGCSLPITVPVGTATVTEVARPGFSVDSIATFPSGRLVSSDMAARTARVSIVAGGVSNQTIVTFANKTTPKGFLEVCKAKPNGDDLSGNFNFTVSQTGSPTRTVTVPVGGCSLPIQLFAGTASVTEVARTGAELVGIAATPPGRLVDSNVASRSATVRIVAGELATQTIVTFTNKTAPPPKPPTGLVKICKRAGEGVEPGTTFTFTLATRETRSVDVKAESCSAPQEVPAGNLTVTEKATAGLQVSKIVVEPGAALVGSPDLTAGTVTVKVTADEVTEVEFTNRTAPPGTVKVCKVAGHGVVPRTPFNFTAGTTPVTVLAGSCSLPMTMPAGNLTITEAATTGLQVTDITVAGAGALVTKDLAAGKATINVASSLVTEVVFTNAKPSKPVTGCVHDLRWFKKQYEVVEDLVPDGGLVVGGDRLTAAQVRFILKKAAKDWSFRFELQGELIAALLNQLGGATTPTEVQTAIDATQFLLSQDDGALQSGTMNTRKMGWWTTVTFNGKTYKASQLADTLSSYNEGEAKGGPRSCDKRKYWDDGHEDGKQKRHHYKKNGNRFCWPI
jgi:hypothetical protein